MNKTYKIGVYVRVSTEEQAENPEGSIKNQEERLRDFIKLKNHMQPFGEIVDVFVDAGISAKDMNRPSLKRLLSQIESKEIDMVLVTELSRFTRSMKDFSILREFLQRHNCQFLSLRENFDTSTAAGEMVLYMMANIAQFERKQTAERISQSFLARAKRGLVNGGPIPLGYEIDPDRNGHLRVILEEAEVVRLIFLTFLKEETLARTAKALNDSGIRIPIRVSRHRTKSSPLFRIDSIHHILRNKTYIGVRVFNSKAGVQEAKAAWEPIIDEETFQLAQRLLQKNRYRKRSHGDNRHPYLLSGHLFCKVCGNRLSGKSAHGRNGKIPYYEHAWATKANANLNKKVFHCEPHRIQAGKIEEVVWREVKSFLTNEKIMKELLLEASSKRTSKTSDNKLSYLEKRFKGIKTQIEALAERISVLPKDIDPQALYEQLKKLQSQKLETEGSLLIARTEQVKPEEILELSDLKQFTEGIRKHLLKAEEDPNIQTTIIKKIVYKIEITIHGIEIHFHVGKSHYTKELGAAPGSFLLHLEQVCSKKSNATEYQNNVIELGPVRSGPLPKFLKDCGSKRLTNGGGKRARTADLLTASQTLYQLSYTPKTASKKIAEKSPKMQQTISCQLGLLVVCY
jgi:site-specific DNA recombinase